MRTTLYILLFLGAFSFQDLRAEPVSTAVAAAAAFLSASTAVAAIATAVKVASLAYSAYSAYSAHRQGQKAASAAKRAALESRERNARRNFRASIIPKRIVYGRERLGGAYLFADNPNSNEAVIVVSLADHKINEVEQVFLMDEELVLDDVSAGSVAGKYAGHINYWVYSGLDNQNVGAKLIELGSTSVLPTDTFAGTACIVVKTTDLLINFPDVDFNISAVFKGKSVYDPRAGFTTWTDNAALCAADYCIEYMNFDHSKINMESLAESADVCDELVMRKDGSTEQRYTCNGVITADTEHRAVLPDLALTMAGNIAFSSGQWYFLAGQKVDVSETFTNDDIIGEFEYIYKGSSKDIPNVGKGTFKSPDHNWQSVSIPEYVDADRLDLANGERNEIDIAMPFTNSGTMAQRILKIAVKRAQQEESCTLQMKPCALAVKTTDVAMFSIPRHGIDNEAFEIRDFSTRYVNSGDGVNYDCTVSIIKYDETTFDYDALTEEQEIPTASVTLGNVSAHAPTELVLINNGSDYTLQWIDPDPESKNLESLDVEHCYILNSMEECEESEVDKGDEEFDFSLPDGAVYSSIKIRAKYEDNTMSTYVTI